jgi:hypothetical protein
MWKEVRMAEPGKAAKPCNHHAGLTSIKEVRIKNWNYSTNHEWQRCDKALVGILGPRETSDLALPPSQNWLCLSVHSTLPCHEKQPVEASPCCKHSKDLGSSRALGQGCFHGLNSEWAFLGCTALEKLLTFICMTWTFPENVLSAGSSLTTMGKWSVINWLEFFCYTRKPQVAKECL